MIRRFYILPLRPGVPDARVAELVRVLGASDRYIPGLKDSSAGLDLTSRTVLWENTFVDEASYAGPYMVHPYHIGAIDNYVMADSPECLTHDIYTMRYQTADATQRHRRGIRRVLLLNLRDEAAASAVGELADAADGVMAASEFGSDDVGWVSAKGRAWTHVWEQAFTDLDHLEGHLSSRDGIACSSVEGFTRLGIAVDSLRIFTCPFELTPAGEQHPAEPEVDGPVLYSITARTAAGDVGAFADLLARHYDPFMAGVGSPLLHRWTTVDQGYLEGEVQSTWQIDSLAAYSDIRASTYADPGWNAFVRDAMPLVRGGTRRFHTLR